MTELIDGDLGAAASMRYFPIHCHHDYQNPHLAIQPYGALQGDREALPFHWEVLSPPRLARRLAYLYLVPTHIPLRS